MKSTILLLALSLAPVAHADQVTNCFVAASVGQAVARERDKGTHPVAIRPIIQKEFHDDVNPIALDQLTEAVYSNPDVTQEQVYSRVLQSCVDLTIPI